MVQLVVPANEHSTLSAHRSLMFVIYSYEHILPICTPSPKMFSKPIVNSASAKEVAYPVRVLSH